MRISGRPLHLLRLPWAFPSAWHYGRRKRQCKRYRKGGDASSRWIGEIIWKGREDLGSRTLSSAFIQSKNNSLRSFGSNWGGRGRSGGDRRGSSRWWNGWGGEGNDTVVWTITPLSMVNRARHGDNIRGGSNGLGWEEGRGGGSGAEIRKPLARRWHCFYTGGPQQLPAGAFVLFQKLSIGAVDRSSRPRSEAGWAVSPRRSSKYVAGQFT